MKTTITNQHHDVVIIGAGVGGLYMLHTCRKLGLDAIVLERGSGVGGTWYWNRYPGARCDVESLDYSYSFDDALQREWRWTEKYPTQPEILAYLEHVADRFDLKRDIHFNVNVQHANFEDAANTWKIRAKDGSVYSATYLIAATGALSEAKDSHFAGQDDFAGAILRSSNWPQDGFDFSGKRAAVIGTGSTGIQIAPMIAKDASKLFVFQRTPSYSIPAFNRFLTKQEVDEAIATYPERRKVARASVLGVDTQNPNISTWDVSEADRQKAYHANYDYGGPMKLVTTFNDPIFDKKANDVLAAFLAERIRERVGNPEWADRVLIPNYPVASRRLCVDTDYFETLTRDNVELIDTRSDPIQRFTPTGIQTKNAQYEVDVIVLATGFDALTGALRALDPHGRGGVSLRRKWDEYPASYLGVMVSGFPNFFTITGPLSPSVNSNMFVAIEQHVEFIAKLLARAHSQGNAVVEPTAEAEKQWIDHAAQIASQTVFPLTDSWYTGANIPGKASAVMPYLGGIGGFQAQLDAIEADGFRGFKFTALEPATA